jgi:predicted MFS family arabinose efflux permease
MLAPEIRTLIGMVLVSAISNLGQSVQPFIVGGAVDVLGLSTIKAGQLASIELVGFACGSLVCSTRIHIWNRRHLCLLGAAGVVVGNALCCFAQTFVPLLLLRILAGIGSALACSAFSSTAAATKAPDRTFGIVNAVSIAGSGVAVWGAALVAARWKLDGIFATLAGLALLFSGGAFLIPPHPFATQAVVDGGEANLRELTATSRRSGIAVCLAMMFAVFAGQGAIWAYQERIGASIGLDDRTIGFWLGSGRLVFGAGASLLAGYIALRLGRLLPQVISFFGSIVAVEILGLMSHPAFAFGSTMLTAAWFWGLAYQQGLLSSFDRSGRANVASDAVTTIGLAFGSSVAGFLSANGYRTLISSVAGTLLTGFVLALVALTLLRKVESRIAPNLSRGTKLS